MGKLLSTGKVFVIRYFSEPKLQPRVPWGCVPEEHYAILPSPTLRVIASNLAWCVFPQSGTNPDPVLIMNSLAVDMTRDE